MSGAAAAPFADDAGAGDFRNADDAANTPHLRVGEPASSFNPIISAFAALAGRAGSDALSATGSEDALLPPDSRSPGSTLGASASRDDSAIGSNAFASSAADTDRFDRSALTPLRAAYGSTGGSEVPCSPHGGLQSLIPKYSAGVSRQQRVSFAATNPPWQHGPHDRSGDGSAESVSASGGSMTKPIEECSGDVSSLESKHLAHLAAAPRRTSVMLKHNSVVPLPEEGGSRQVSAATNFA